MTQLLLRDGVSDDVADMSAFLMVLRGMGIRQSPGDPAFVQSNYIDAADRIKLTVVQLDGAVVGFQSLKRATPGNIYDVTPGWGVIGTHISPTAWGLGLGRQLFAESAAAARAEGLPFIDASIGADNRNGQGYYDAMGFRTYRTPPGLVCKRYTVA